MINPNDTPMLNGCPMMMVRMRCPACRHDDRFLVEVTLPLYDLPEVTKRVMKCKCRNRIPKINKNTSIDSTLMSVNAVPLRMLKEQGVFPRPGVSVN